MRLKNQFGTLIIYLVTLLMVLPFLVTFNHALTRFFESISIYSLIQSYVVPIQMKLVGMIVSFFGARFIPTPTGMIVGNTQLTITWNCIGWQSLLLFFTSAFVGLKGANFSRVSSIKLVILGICGIFWVNIFRMSFTVILANFSMSAFRIVFHDYLSAFVTILYLFIFWKFAYGHFERGTTSSLTNIKASREN